MVTKDRRIFLKGLGLGAAAMAWPGCLGMGPEALKRPNILFIMTDDHAAQALSCYGSRINATPHLDRLARGGVRLDQAFCTNAICAPSRAVLLTGKYSHLNGVVDNGAAFDGSQVTFPKLLQAAGYETALFGKWHLKSAPTGFDHHAILPGQGHYYNPVIIENGEKRQRPGYVTDLITDDCLTWLKNRERHDPFCVLLHHKAPHRNWMPDEKHLDLYEGEEIPEPQTLFDDYATRGPAAREQEMTISDHLFPAYDLKLDPPPPRDDEPENVTRDRRMWENIFNRLDENQQAVWHDAYDPRNARFHDAPPGGRDLVRWKYQRYIKDYLRCIASVDENIGRVLDFLDAQGLADDTVVVYTSDQGFYLGEHGWYDKRFIYEESLRIPLIVRYPREIVPGSADSEHLALNLDFAPTFLDYARVSPPREMQGRSLRTVLRGSAPSDWRQSIYYHYYEYPGVHAVKRHYGVRTLRYKLAHFYHDIDVWELYDLQKDPHELNNLYDDPAYAAIRAELEEELKRLRIQYRDSDDDPYHLKPLERRKHKAVNRPVRLTNAYSSRYPGGGPNALTNGRLSPDPLSRQSDYRAFQGFEVVDLEATVDLGEATRLRRISAGFLQHGRDWIFLPRSVEFEVSDDGHSFRSVGTRKPKKSMQEGGLFKESFHVEFAETAARFVRVRAVNAGRCPDWHGGAGGKAWLFADEIVVE